MGPLVAHVVFNLTAVLRAKGANWPAFVKADDAGTSVLIALALISLAFAAARSTGIAEDPGAGDR